MNENLSLNLRTEISDLWLQWHCFSFPLIYLLIADPSSCMLTGCDLFTFGDHSFWSCLGFLDCPKVCDLRWWECWHWCGPVCKMGNAYYWSHVYLSGVWLLSLVVHKISIKNFINLIKVHDEEGESERSWFLGVPFPNILL